MKVTLLGMVTLVRLMHQPNAQFQILVTLLGMVTLVRLVQRTNAQFPMLLTLLGIVTLVRSVSENALSPMAVTGRPVIVLGMTRLLFVPVYPAIVIVPSLVK